MMWSVRLFKYLKYFFCCCCVFAWHCVTVVTHDHSKRVPGSNPHPTFHHCSQHLILLTNRTQEKIFPLLSTFLMTKFKIMYNLLYKWKSLVAFWEPNNENRKWNEKILQLARMWWRYWETGRYTRRVGWGCRRAAAQLQDQSFVQTGTEHPQPLQNDL